MTRLLSTLLATVSLALAGTTPKAAPVQGQHSAQTDAQIEQTLRTRLAKSKIGADHFRFRVQGGVVYWEGTTDVVQHKGSATRMAKAAGARAVVNKIQVSAAARAKAAANLESGRRRAQVKRGDARTQDRGEAARSR